MCSRGRTCGTSTVNSPCAGCGGTGTVTQVLYSKGRFGRERHDGSMTHNCVTCGGKRTVRIRVTLCGRAL